MKTIQRNASDAEIFGRMMKTAQHGTFDGLVQEGGTLPQPNEDKKLARTCYGTLPQTTVF